MKTRPTPPLNAAQREALEARFALRLSARLETGAQSLPHDISERLRVAREQAVRAARDARLATAPMTAPAQVTVGVAGLSTAGAGGMGTSGVTMGGWNESAQSRLPGHGRRLDDAPTAWGWRLASALPALALLVGLWGIHQYTRHEQVQAATDVDMALLTDDLPPTAYADPGFAEFLRSDTGPSVRSLDATPPEADGDLKTTDTVPAVSTP